MWCVGKEAVYVRGEKPESPWAAHVLTLVEEGHLKASRCFELP